MSAFAYALVDWFIPAALKAVPERFQRARLFVISHFCGAPLGLVVFGYILIIDADPGWRAVVLCAGLAAFLVYPFLLRATGQFDLLTIFSMEQFGLLVLYGAYHYGGVSSPFMPWIIAIPVIILYHFGARPFWRALVFVAMAVHLAGFYLLYRLGGGFPAHVPPQSFIGVGLLSLLCAALFVAMTSLYHGSVVDAQQVELQREVLSRRLTEIRLREAKEEAERANRAKSEFLAKMSHELRTPLNAIIGFSQIIGSELLGPVGMSRYVEYGGDIERSGQHLLQIISDILDLAKIETGKFVLHEGEFDLVALVKDTIELMRPLAENHGVPILFEGRSGDVRLRADELRVKQILLNLLSNAAKFTEEGGVVKVTVSEERGRGVIINVADTGVGIAAADRERVLQPFEQVGNSSVASASGTGLGLPLARELALLHGGMLTLESEPGRGTSVTVTLPEHRICSYLAADSHLAADAHLAADSHLPVEERRAVNQ